MHDEPLTEDELAFVRNAEKPSFLIKPPVLPSLRNVVRRVDEMEVKMVTQISGLASQLAEVHALVKGGHDARGGSAVA